MTQIRHAGVDVSAETCIPARTGERMDDVLVVEGLFALEFSTKASAEACQGGP